MARFRKFSGKKQNVSSTKNGGISKLKSRVASEKPSEKSTVKLGFTGSAKVGRAPAKADSSLPATVFRKKDRLRKKKEIFAERVRQQAKTASKKRLSARRKRTPIVGDMSAILDALEATSKVPENPNLPSSQQSQKRKERSIPPEKTIRRERDREIQLFKRVLEHADYRRNPLEAIGTFLQERQAHPSH